MKKYLLLFTLLYLLSPLAQAELDLSLPDMNLPDMGDPSSSVLSYTEERDLGKKLYRQLRRTQPVIEDPELSSWLRSLGNQLVARASGSRSQFYFLIIDKPSVNAFAMPGGVIALHTGLILNAESESELAAVLAHEIAHVTQRHIARMFAEEKGSALKTGLGVLAGAIAASQNPELGQAVLTATVASQMQKQLNFSRQAESEADRVGMRILAASGYNPEGMPNFLGKLDRTAGAYRNVTEYLRTHPLSIDRISDTRSRAKQYGKRNRKDDVDFLYAKAKLAAISRTRGKAIGTETPATQKYAQAWQMIRKGQFNQVIQTLGSQSRRPAEAIAIGTALNGLRQYDQTISLLQPLLNNYPDQEAIVIPLAEAHLAKGDTNRAWQLVRRIPVSEQTSLNFLDLRKETARAAGNITEALVAAAQRYIHLGEYKQAQTLLLQATSQSSVGATNNAKLQGLLNQVNSELKSQKRGR